MSPGSGETPILLISRDRPSSSQRWPISGRSPSISRSVYPAGDHTNSTKPLPSLIGADRSAARLAPRRVGRQRHGDGRVLAREIDVDRAVELLDALLDPFERPPAPLGLGVVGDAGLDAAVGR